MARTRKLGYGEGSVYFDKSKGVWRGAITIDGRRRKVSGLTKTEAQEALGDLRDTVNAGLPTEAPRSASGSPGGSKTSERRRRALASRPVPTIAGHSSDIDHLDHQAP